VAKTYGARWEVVRSLRPGGQAETFLVRDQTGALAGEYVLKRVRNPDRHDRFRVEIESLGKLTHPNVVRLIDSSITSEPYYLVTEYCQAGSLEDSSGHWATDPVAALRLVAQVCDGLTAAHAAGILHRDIKPANIGLRTPTGPPVLLDFGIAYVADGERLTLTDEAVGARRFTAPELADGRADVVSARADVYSIGKLVYWLLNGGRVFDREQHRDQHYDLARRDGGDPRLEHVNRLLDNMITLEVSRRYADAGAAAGAVRKVAEMLAQDVRVLDADLPQRCAFCSVGEYATVQLGDPTAVSNFGLKPVATSDWRALVCQNCGNVQLFRPDRTEKRRWWGGSGTVRPVG